MATLVDEKIRILTEIEGYDDPIELCEEVFNDGCCPGICMNEDCESTYSYEPDSTDGWCDECQTNTVKSLMILLGVI